MDDDPPYHLAFNFFDTRWQAWEPVLRNVIQTTLTIRGASTARISVALVTDEEIARLNQKHLNHPGPTDVLTFDLADDRADGVEGELILSADTAIREARRRGHPVEHELALYVTHGLLHLLGFDDHDADAAESMHAVEEEILAGLGMPGIYRAREERSI